MEIETHEFNKGLWHWYVKHEKLQSTFEQVWDMMAKWSENYASDSIYERLYWGIWPV